MKLMLSMGALYGCPGPPSDTHQDTAEIGTDDLGLQCLQAGRVSQPKADAAVELRLVSWISLAEDGEQASEAVNDRCHLIFVEALWWGRADAECGGSRRTNGGRFPDPAGDQRGVTAGVERGAVILDLGVAVRDGAVELFALVVGAECGELGAVVGIGQAAQVRGEGLPAQLAAKEAVDRLDDGFLAEVEHRWVGDLVLPDVIAGCLSDLHTRLTDRGDDLAAARADNRELMVQLDAIQPRQY